MTPRFPESILRAAALAAAFSLFSPIVASAAEEVNEQVDEKLEAVRAKVKETFEIVGPEHVHRSQVDGWYMIQKGSIIAYISEDTRYLLQGDLIDLDASVNLTEMARDNGRRELIEGLDEAELIVFTPEEVKHRITVFTDTGCTYCRRLHSQINEYLEQGIEVRYLLYPRNGPASREWLMSEKVWCASNRSSALTAAKLDREFPTANCDASKIQEHYLLGQEIGLTGTPAIVLDDGTLISGYVPPAALAEQLNGAPGPQASR